MSVVNIILGGEIIGKGDFIKIPEPKDTTKTTKDFDFEGFLLETTTQQMLDNVLSWYDRVRQEYTFALLNPEE